MANLDLATLLIRIDAKLDGLTDGLQEAGDKSKAAAKEVESSWQNTAIQLKNVGEEISSAFGDAIGDFLKEAIDYAGDFTETLSKTETVFGSMSDSIVEWSETSIESMGVAQSTALEMVSLFGDMATGMGFTTAEAANMSMNLTQLAADLASFKNISVDQAESALKGVFTGESESLKSLGIIMNETTLSEYALAQGITTSYSAMSNAEKVALRYQYVMEATSNAQGDFERTGDSLSNQEKKLSENIKELATSIGERLEPIVTRIVSALNTVVTWFDSLNPAIQTAIALVGGAVAVLGPLLTVIGTLGTVIPALIASVSAAAAPILAVVAAVGLVGAAFVGITSSLNSATEAHEETAKELQKSIDSDINYNVNVKETTVDGSTATERMNAIKDEALNDGTLIRGSLSGALTFGDTSSLTETQSLLAQCVTDTGNYADKVVELQENIQTMFEEEQAQINNTYNMLILAYIAAASASGIPESQIQAQVDQLDKERQTLLASAEMSAEDQSKLVEIFADGISEDDLPALEELINKYPQLKEELLGLLDDDQVSAAMSAWAEQPEMAASAWEVAQYRIQQSSESTDKTVLKSTQNTYKQIQDLNTNGANFAEEMGEYYQLTGDALNTLTLDYGTYFSNMQQYGTDAANEILKQTLIDKGYTEEEASSMVSTISDYVQKGLEEGKTMEEILSSAWEDSVTAQQISEDLSTKSMSEWSETTLAAFRQYCADRGFILDESSDTEKELTESYMNQINEIRNAKDEASLQEAKDYLMLAQGMTEAQADEYIKGLQGNQEYWDAYDKAIEDGVITAEELMQLLDLAEGAEEKGEEAGEGLGKGIEEGADGTEVNPEVEVNPETNTNTDEVTEEVQEDIEGTDTEATVPVELNADTSGTEQAVDEYKAQAEEKIEEDPIQATVTTDQDSWMAAGAECGLAFAGAVSETITNNIETVTTSIQSLIETAGSQATLMSGHGRTTGQNYITGIQTGITRNMSKVTTAINRIINKVKSYSETAQNGGKTVGQALVEGMISGIESKSSSLYSKIADVVKKAVEKAKDTADVNSPSKLTWHEVGEPLVEGIEKGVTVEAPNLYNTMKELVNGVVTSGKSTVPAIIKSDTPITTGRQSTNSVYVNQTNNFTTTEMTPYETQMQIYKMNKQLAKSFA